MKLILGVVIAVAAYGQTAPPRAEFEVASVKPSAPLGVTPVQVGVHIDGAQVRCTSLTMKDYIAMAYKMKTYQVAGPDWIGSERFDIAAKLPDGATREQVPEMVQSLLADRFRMKVHRGKKEFPVYGLVAGKGAIRVKESPTEEGPPASESAKGAVNVTATGGRGGTMVNLGNGSSFSIANNRLEGKKLTMAQLADLLARFVDRPVVDMTEVKGAYDLTLEFTPEDFRAMMVRSAIAAGVVLPPEALRALELGSGDSLTAALQSVGLKLESRKAPLEVLVVDQALKTPTEN